jgi:hypothetical protein
MAAFLVVGWSGQIGAGGLEVIASAASAQIAQWAYGKDAASRPASVYHKM